MTSAALLRQAAATLPGDTPRLDAEVLLAHALGVSRLDLLAAPRQVPEAALAAFEAMLVRRRTHEPVAYIIGRREFWSLDLLVSPAVLVPRPDSETLIAAAIDALSQRPPARILDFGTGSGALLLAALREWPRATGLGIDRSAAAIDVAAANAALLGMAARAHFEVGDWGEGLDGTYDLILANPPYVPEGAALPKDVADFEPHAALFAGPDGLEAFRALLPHVARLLAATGVALVEFGVGQGQALLAMGRALGLEGDIRPDLAGRPRSVRFRRFPLGKGDSSG